jgi:hypothetical protein
LANMAEIFLVWRFGDDGAMSRQSSGRPRP